ncbi:hypothetical protein [Bacterioplanoides sp.]|uniref:hypothetical protein n=1 Tax=Bacterioplanoides sp. TaxID=2066072 RepID=UPI003B5C512C
MDQNTIKRIQARQEQRRLNILNHFNRGTAALDLAKMALEHSSNSAEAAARLLLSMENGTSFEFRFLLFLDVENRAKADLMTMGYKHHDRWPSKWIDAAGSNGKEIMNKVKRKWHFNPEVMQ